jgi:hypothetical protein
VHCDKPDHEAPTGGPRSVGLLVPEMVDGQRRREGDGQAAPRFLDLTVLDPGTLARRLPAAFNDRTKPRWTGENRFLNNSRH